MKGTKKAAPKAGFNLKTRMEMKINAIVALAAAAMLCGCQKETLIPQKNIEGQGQVFTATMEGAPAPIENAPATKATFDSGTKCAAWEVGDVISIDGHEYQATVAGASSTFNGSGATEGTHHAYFPASLYSGKLPEVQTYKAGKFDMPMYAESTTTSLSFKNLCAVLAIKVTSEDISTLKSIKVASDKKMNGSFTVSEGKAVLGAGGSNEVVLECTEALALDEAGTTFHIAIPAQEYQYLKIYISADGAGYKEVMATKKASGLGLLGRNKIFAIDYEKNAVQLWESGPFFATVNVGASSPQSYGGYYAWGETKAYGEADTSNNHNYQTKGSYTKTTFSWATYKFSSGSAAKNINKYTFADDYNKKNSPDWYDGDTFVGDNKRTLDPEDDAAYMNWGASWRMPRLDELASMLKNCTWTWVRLSGYNVAGRNGNSIFLPACGYRLNDNLYEGNGGGSGCYWANSLSGTYSYTSGALYFNQITKECRTPNRNLGYSVRAVCQ